MAKYTQRKDTPVEETEVIEEIDAVEESEKEDTLKEETVKEEKPSKKEVKTKKKFESSDLIVCRSVTQGALYMEGAKTNMLYTWADYGDECEVEYRDLVSVVRTRSSYVFAPHFIIEDEDFIAEFPQLQKYYKDNYSVKELAEILEQPVGQMLETLKALPKSALDAVRDMAAVQVGTGQLDSVRKIKALDEFFNTDLDLISDVLKK